MKKSLISLAICAAFCVAINDVIVKDQKIFVDGWEFFIKVRITRLVNWMRQSVLTLSHRELPIILPH